MPITNELRKVLIVVADLTNRNVNADTHDIVIFERLNHIPEEKVNKYLHELSNLGLIAQRGEPKLGMDIRLFHLTKEGLNTLIT